MKNDMVGKVFGRLTVLSSAGVVRGRGTWLCRCDCGVEKTIMRQSLVVGATVSCGCYGKELRVLVNTKHGHSAGGGRTPEYTAWNSMMQRCGNPRAQSYAWYGGRGITICEAWHDFSAFERDMGPRPAGHSIDRINNSGNYEPGNCRWATRKQQQRNMRSNKLLTFNGKTQPLAAWAEEAGLTNETIRNRLRMGWEISHALTVPSDDRKLSVARNGRAALLEKEAAQNG